MAAAIDEVHPVLMARDVAESISWFGRLGFLPIFMDDSAAPRYAAIRRDSVELHLQWGDGSQWEHSGDRPVYRFLCPDVDAVYAAFEQAGVSVGTEGPWAYPGNTPWHTREFHVRDPAGNVLQFYQRMATE